jgi:hypothetical protein
MADEKSEAQLPPPAGVPPPPSPAVLLTQEEKGKLLAALNSVVNLPCPRCGNPKFEIANGLIKLPLNDSSNNVTLGGEMVPCAATYCTRCGFITLHALGVFGFLNPAGIKI